MTKPNATTMCAGQRFADAMRRRARSGNVLLSTIIVLPALFGFVSLAVDYGRLIGARSELRDATDAAARHAAGGISSGPSTVRARAKESAAENRVVGTALVLTDADIQLGMWDQNAETFTVLSGAAEATANAVRINAVRSASRGTAIPLVFAKLIGVSSSDIYARATAAVSTTEGSSGYAVVGLSEVKMENNAIVDSYNSSSGAYSAGIATSQAEVSSNDEFEMKNNAQVRGNAHAGPGESVEFNNHASVTGNTTSLAQEQEFDDVDTSTAASSNNNSAIPAAYFSSGSRKFELENNESYTLPAGTYYFDEFKLKNNTLLTFGGAVNIYTTGKVELENNARLTAYENRPGNVRLYVDEADVKLKNNVLVQAAIYAPGSKFEIENNAELSGILVANEIKLKNNSKIHADLSISGSGGSSGAASGAVAIVE